MPLHSRSRTILLLFLAVLPLSGCLFRSRKVEQSFSTAPLKTASQQQLLDYINGQAGKIQSIQATVDIDTTVGGIKKGKVTDYQQIRGYVLARKPSMLRMIGLMPVVRNKAFDMVSDGRIFKLWIPPKNRFVIGRNDVPSKPAQSPLESIRPQQIYEALLIPAIDPKDEIAVMENDYEVVTDSKGHRVEQPDYEVAVIRKHDSGWYLERKIVFSRTDLLPHRQLIYNENGDLATNIRYDAYKDYNGISFPSQIEIWRPREEYDITLTMVKLEINPALTDDKFALAQPPGAEVVNLDQNQTSQAGSTGQVRSNR
jgi:outer membrane lipoprotein-sorting protein